MRLLSVAVAIITIILGVLPVSLRAQDTPPPLPEPDLTQCWIGETMLTLPNQDIETLALNWYYGTVD